MNEPHPEEQFPAAQVLESFKTLNWSHQDMRDYVRSLSTPDAISKASVQLTYRGGVMTGLNSLFGMMTGQSSTAMTDTAAAASSTAASDSDVSSVVRQHAPKRQARGGRKGAAKGAGSRPPRSAAAAGGADDGGSSSAGGPSGGGSGEGGDGGDEGGEGKRSGEAEAEAGNGSPTVNDLIAEFPAGTHLIMQQIHSH